MASEATRKRGAPQGLLPIQHTLAKAARAPWEADAGRLGFGEINT